MITEKEVNTLIKVDTTEMNKLEQQLHIDLHGFWLLRYEDTPSHYNPDILMSNEERGRGTRTPWLSLQLHKQTVKTEIRTSRFWNAPAYSLDNSLAKTWYLAREGKPTVEDMQHAAEIIVAERVESLKTELAQREKADQEWRSRQEAADLFLSEF